MAWKAIDTNNLKEIRGHKVVRKDWLESFGIQAYYIIKYRNYTVYIKKDDVFDERVFINIDAQIAFRETPYFKTHMRKDSDNIIYAHIGTNIGTLNYYKWRD